MKKFTIEEGKHSAKGLNFGLTFKKDIKFKAMFDESCLYKINKHNSDRFDVNKLFGISTKWNHHKQSSRVGWRCLDGENIELFPYVYTDGKLLLDYLKEPITTVKPKEEFSFQIIDRETFVSFQFKRLNKSETQKNMDIKIIEKSPDWFFFHYYLFPYFGGNLKAPHDMKVYIELL